MARLWNLIEAHYFIAAFLVWVIIEETSKVLRQFLRTIQLHPDYHTHNHTHHNYDGSSHEEGDTEDDEDTDTGPTPPSNTMSNHPQPNQTRRADPDPSPGLLTRAERVLRNLKG